MLGGVKNFSRYRPLGVSATSGSGEAEAVQSVVNRSTADSLSFHELARRPLEYTGPVRLRLSLADHIGNHKRNHARFSHALLLLSGNRCDDELPVPSGCLPVGLSDF